MGSYLDEPAGSAASSFWMRNHEVVEFPDQNLHRVACCLRDRVTGVLGCGREIFEGQRSLDEQ
jgi:hypothetical protein